jgi:hypothetical protein
LFQAVIGTAARSGDGRERSERPRRFEPRRPARQGTMCPDRHTAETGEDAVAGRPEVHIQNASMPFSTRTHPRPQPHPAIGQT